MKIALCCKVYPTSRNGGMGFVCQDRARALAKLGHNVHVLTTGRGTHAGELISDKEVEVHHMPCAPSHYSDEFAKHCEHHCKAFKPDMLHTDSFDVNRPWQVSGVAESIGCRTAVTMHGFCWGAYFTDLNLWMRHGGSPPQLDTAGVERERNILLGFDMVIGISLHEQWMMTNLLGIYNAKLIYNPLPDYFFENITSKLPDGKRQFLCSAVSGYHQRGFAIAEKAAKQAGVGLVIARDLKREELPALIDSCHGLVLPTAYAQGLDLTVGEAAVRRRPIFTTATGSYQRESEKGGIYYCAMRTFPLSGVGLANHLTERLDWPVYNHAKTDAHRAETHAKLWLETILG